MSIFYNNGTAQENSRFSITGYGDSSNSTVVIKPERKADDEIGSQINSFSPVIPALVNTPLAYNNPFPIKMIYSTRIGKSEKTIAGNYYIDIDTSSKGKDIIDPSNFGSVNPSKVIYGGGGGTNYTPISPPGSLGSEDEVGGISLDVGVGWYCAYGVECNPPRVFYNPEPFEGTLGGFGFCGVNGPYPTSFEASQHCEYEPPPPPEPPPPVDSLPPDQKVTGYYYSALITKLSDFSRPVSEYVYGYGQNIPSTVGGNTRLIISTDKYLQPGAYVRDISSIAPSNLFTGEVILGQNATHNLFYCFDSNKLAQGDTYGYHRCISADVYSQAYGWGWNEDVRTIVGGPFLNASKCNSCDPPSGFAPGDAKDPTHTDEFLKEKYNHGYAGDFEYLENGIYMVQLLNRDTYPLGNVPAPLLPWTSPIKRPDSTWPYARPFCIGVHNGVVRFRPPLDVSSVGPQTNAYYGNYTIDAGNEVVGLDQQGQCFAHTEPELTLEQAFILEATIEYSWLVNNMTTYERQVLESYEDYPTGTNDLIISALYSLLGYDSALSFNKLLHSKGICTRYSLAGFNTNPGGLQRIPLCDRKLPVNIEFLYPDDPVGTPLRNVWKNCSWCLPEAGFDSKIPYIREPLTTKNWDQTDIIIAENFKPCFPHRFNTNSDCNNFVAENRVGTGPAPDFKPIIDPSLEPLCQCNQGGGGVVGFA